MAEKGTLWASIEEMPEFQEKTPEEKLGYASYFLEKQAAKLAPDLADNPEGQAYFREKSKEFIFGIADRHFPSGLEAAPSQIGESLAREDRALSVEGARLNTEIGKQAATTLAGLEGKPDDEILKGDPTTFQTLSPNQDTTVGEYRSYLQSVIDAQAEKGGRKAGDIVESFEESAKRTPSAAMLKLQLSEGWAGWDELIAKSEDPIATAIAAISGTMLESSVQSAKGAVAGGAVAAATGNPFAGGAAMGAVAADSEFQATYLGELQSELQKRGKSDAATIQEILRDDEFNARVDKKAMTRGVTIGATEAVAGAVSFGIANKIGTTTAKKALIGVGAEAGIGAAGGSGGEFLARLFSGEDVWTPEARKDIVSEGVAELGQAGTGTATVAFDELARRRSQSAQSETQPSLPSTNEEETLQAQTPPQVNEPATPEPEVDDAPVRSVLEEFSDEADATEVPSPDVPAVETAPVESAPIPPAPALDEVTGEEVNTPETATTPDVVDEIANEPVEIDEPRTVRTFDIDDGLAVSVVQNPDGTATVQKTNTETGVTIPLEGAESAFADIPSAVEFIGRTFSQNEDGEIVSESAASDPGLMARGEQDKLMQLLIAEKMQPSQADIRTIGRKARKEGKGFRATESDAISRSNYEGAPLIRDYEGNPAAQERLRRVYSRESKNRPDQVAQMAFNEGLIPEPTAEALFQAIKDRLDGDAGRVSQVRESDADVAAMVAERASQVEDDAAAFYRGIKSPYRRGGVVAARQLQMGDRLQVGNDVLEVTDANEDGITVRSSKHGIYPLSPDETVGYDSILEENGIPVGEREGTMPSQVVSREETEAMTKALRDALRKSKAGINWGGRVFSSREHGALVRSRSELEAARRLADLFGRRLVGVTDDFPANGVVLPGTDPLALQNLFIAVDASRPEITVAAHEMLHLLRKSDSDLYQELVNTLEADITAYINETRPELAGSDLDSVVEEFLADYVSEMAGRPQFWESLASRDASLFERFSNFVIAFLREIRDRIAGDKIKVERYLRDAAAMHRTLEDVLVAFKARQSQERAGVLDTSLEDSMPFADRRTQPIKGPAFVGMERNGEAFKMPFTVPLRDGSRISGYTDSKLTTFYGYDKNGDQFTWSVSRFRIDDVDTSKRKGEARAELERFIDSVRSAQEFDIRFADRKTKPNQQVMGQLIGREDEIQSKAEVQGIIKAEYFDGDFTTTTFGKTTAFALLEDLEAGVINPSQDTGLDGANQALKGELWKFSLKMLAEGDASLFERMRGSANDYFERESTRAGRALNALSWYTRQLDQTLAEVEKGKRSKVNELAPVENGQVQDLAAEIERLQKEVDALRLQVSDFSHAEIAEVVGKVEGKRTTGGSDRAAKILTGGKKGGSRIAKLASELDDFLRGGASDVMFSDVEIIDELRPLAIRRILEEQISSGRRKRAVFIRNLTKLGMSEEVAANRFEKAMEFRERAKQALKEDQAESKAEDAPKSATTLLLESLDEESKRNDRLNRKVESIADRLTNGPKKRETDPSKKSDLDKFVAAEIAKGAAFDREAAIKGALRLEIKAGSAARLTDAIQAEINSRASRQTKPKTASDRAAAIADRFNNPQDRPARAKDPLRVLVNATLRKDSKITEAEFMSRANTIGVRKVEASDLWNALANERRERQKIRDLKRQADLESQPDKEAKAIISKLAASQSDTQDNRPQKTRENAIRAIYQDYVSHGAYGERPGPAMSQPAFIRALMEEGVSQSEASSLATLATREKQNRLETAKGKASVNAIERSVPFIMREILAHPSLRLVGPAERLRMMARVFEDRAGLTPVDARAAAAKFEAQLVKKWDEAAKRIADEYAAKRNAPGFRREPGSAPSNPNKKTPFDKIREAIRAGAYDPRKRVLDEVAKANGWTDLSDVELQRLAELDAALDAADLTDLEASTIKREMARIIHHSALPPETQKVIREYILANSFSGVRTWGVQFSSLFSHAVNVIVRDSMASIYGSATGSSSLNWSGYVSAHRGFLRHLRTGLADAGVTFSRGVIRGTAEAEILNSTSRLEQIHDRALVVLSDRRSTKAQKAGAIRNMLASTVRIFLRILGTLDGLMQGMIRSWTHEIELFSAASGMGLTQKEIKALVGSVMLMAEDFSKIADEKGFGDITVRGRELPIPSPAKMAYVNDRITMALHAALSDSESLGDRALPADLIAESKARSFKESALETGVNEIEKGISYLPGKVANFAIDAVNDKDAPAWVTWLFLVVRTRFNMFRRSGWFGAVGLLRLYRVGKKTEGFTKWKDENGNPITQYETSLSDPTQLARRATEALIGTALQLGVGVLIASQMDKEDEDKLFKLNLGGPSPSDRAAYTTFRKMGFRPNSIQVRIDKNDEFLTIGFRGGGLEVLNFPLTVLGAWEQSRYTKHRNQPRMMAYALTLKDELAGEYFFPLAPFTSRSTTFRPDNAASYMGYLASSLVPAAAMLRTPIRFTRDFQDYEGPGAAFAAQIPIVNYWSPNNPRLNSLGDPIGALERDNSNKLSLVGIPVGFTKPIAPWVPGTKPTNDQLYLLLSKKEYFPGDLNPSDLPDDASFSTYREIVIKRGEIIKGFLERNYGPLSEMSNEAFKEKLSARVGLATKEAKKLLKIKSQ